MASEREIKLVLGKDSISCAAPGCKAELEKAELSKTQDGNLRLTCTCSAGHITAFDTSGVKASLITKESKQKGNTYRTKLSGVTFENADGTNRQKLLRFVKVGDTLQLRRIKLPDGGWVYGAQHELGVIGSIKTSAIREYVSQASVSRFLIRVTQVTGGQEGKETLGCNVEFYPAGPDEGQSMDEPWLPAAGPAPTPGPNEVPVYLDPNKRVYHKEEHCSGLKNGERMPLWKAAFTLKARPCKKCGAPTPEQRKEK